MKIKNKFSIPRPENKVLWLTENQRFSEPKNAYAFSGIQLLQVEDFKRYNFGK